MDTGAAYLDEARRALRGHKRLAEGAVAQLRDDELFLQADPEANSAAILLKHIGRNLRSRFTDFLTSDGEKPDRHRDQEFELTGKESREELLRVWENGWQAAFDTIASLKPEDLARTVTIRGEPYTAMQAIHRAVAHAVYHVGQIVYVAKHIRGGEWKTLSIPRGKSEEFNAQKRSGKGDGAHVLDANRSEDLKQTKLP
ncbi:MAG: DUF1572 family protein [Terriglobales bacterium]